MATMPPIWIMAAASARTSGEGRFASMTTRRMTAASETNLHVLRRRHVNAVDEADAVRVVLHDDGARADSVAEEPDTLHQRPFRDAGGGEDDVVARREIPRLVDLLEIGDAHGAAALLMLRLADDQAREDLAVEAAHCRRGQHALGRAARPHQRVDARASRGSGDAGRQVAVADEADARADLADVGNQLLVT